MNATIGSQVENRFALWSESEACWVCRYAKPETILGTIDGKLFFNDQAKFRVHTEDETPPTTPACVPAFFDSTDPETRKARAALLESAAV